MELGVALPTSPPFASPAHIIRIAQAAEEFGYAALWTYERPLQRWATFISAVPQSRLIGRGACRTGSGGRWP